MLDKLQQDLKQAQLSRDEIKVSTLRMLLSEIKNAEIAKGGNLNNEEVLFVVGKEVKKRKEAAAGFRQGNREDAALKEETELSILENYLPQQLSDDDLAKIIDEAMEQTSASSISDMGKVIGAVMGKAQGQAEGARVSALVKDKLAK